MNCRNCGSNSFIFKKGNYYCEYCKSIYDGKKVENKNAVKKSSNEEYKKELPPKGYYKALVLYANYEIMYLGYLIKLIFIPYDEEVLDMKYDDNLQKHEIMLISKDIHEGCKRLKEILKECETQGIYIDISNIRKIFKHKGRRWIDEQCTPRPTQMWL